MTTVPARIVALRRPVLLSTLLVVFGTAPGLAQTRIGPADREALELTVYEGFAQVRDTRRPAGGVVLWTGIPSTLDPGTVVAVRGGEPVPLADLRVRTSGLDTGAIYAEARVPIHDDLSLAELRSILVEHGTRLLLTLLRDVLGLTVTLDAPLESQRAKQTLGVPADARCAGARARRGREGARARANEALACRG